jgi:hypothetical protein
LAGELFSVPSGGLQGFFSCELAVSGLSVLALSEEAAGTSVDAGELLVVSPYVVFTSVASSGMVQPPRPKTVRRDKKNATG